jgi:hypothetical protein
MPKIGTDSYHPCLSYYNPFVNGTYQSGTSVTIAVFFLPLPWVKKGGQASSEDLLPLGYGEWDRAGVRV